MSSSESSQPPAPADASKFSLGLQQAKEEAPPTPLTAKERDALAAKRVGTVLKGWRLERLLGVGPVTGAYEAHRGAKDAHEQGVVKLVIGPLAESERARALFLRASYAANRFNHSRVVPILEDGADEKGAPFVVRPWANATPLSALAGNARLDEKTILRVVEQVLDALEMAHAHGILHGAIVPQNILVTERRSIRLCDFGTPPGVVTVRGAEEDVVAQQRIGPFTAPERCGAIASPATEAADIYSVAACMYWALSGQHPRGEAGGKELAIAAARPLRELVPTVTDAFASIVDHAIQLAPQKRYDSAYAMLGDVRRVMAGRRPKLGDAVSAVPSGSMADVSALSPSSASASPSSRRIPSSQPRDALAPKSALTASLAQRRDKEFRGNVMLILAIALLVGVATFVLVREKVADERGGSDDGAPASTGAR